MSKKNKKTVACLRDDDRGRPPRSSSSACSLPLLLSLPLSNTHSPPQGVPDEPGVLRLVAVAKRNDGAVVMADHYFREEDVVTIVVGRELPRAEKPSIILGH